MSSFPRTLAELKAGDDPLLSSRGFYGSLKELRRSMLSIPNRLRSISEDAEFVQEVAAEYKLPVIANERCGSWYISPEVKAGSAYFKSTDGHTGHWDFSLRRLNLHILDIVGEHGGCIIVDSTRRGKVMPDAFSKTVPIWCAVINRALFPEQQQFHHIQVPGIDLPQTEIAQISSRLDTFLSAFEALGIDREALRHRLGRPMRLQWLICHRKDTLPAQQSTVDGDIDSWHNLILCSASKRVNGAEMSERGYIQGAGDDSEGWSHGMTPLLFWRHKEVLSGAPENALPDLIKKLLLKETQLGQDHKSPVLIEPTNTLYVGGRAGHDYLLEFGFVINCHNREADARDGAKELNLECGPGKLGSRDLRNKLHTVELCAANTLVLNPSCRVLITCESGKDLSVGVALMLLCRFYSENGRCLYEENDDGAPATGRMISTPSVLQQGQKVDKGFIRQRLAWITSCKPDANPSRSTLQSINAYLMGRP